MHTYMHVQVLDRVEDRNPYVNVFLQELERCGELMRELTRSLAELDLGLKGDLQMSERMDALQQALAEDRVPDTWEALAYPSKRPLGLWFINFLERSHNITISNLCTSHRVHVPRKHVRDIMVYIRVCMHMCMCMCVCVCVALKTLY
jgi:hypothetical protein